MAATCFLEITILSDASKLLFLLALQVIDRLDITGPTRQDRKPLDKLCYSAYVCERDVQRAAIL